MPEANEQAVEKRVAELREELARHNKLYYEQDAPELTDAQYDELINELREIEADHPELVTDDSPTQKVGGAPSGRFPQIEHLLPMISLANARNEDELRAWETRLHNRLGQEGITREEFEYVVEGKIDGLAISLIYRDGKLERGVTRGNGVIGEDVTANLLTMNDVPRELPTKDPPALFEARGEVYIKRSDFHALNEARAEAGEATYANPRNTAAGSLRQIDVELTKSRPLSLWGYGVGALDGIEFKNHSEELDQLREWGFPVNDFEVLTGVDDVAVACHRWEERREGLDYEIDGAVVKVNETDLMRRAGISGREPRGAIAWKFPPMEEQTTLLEIIWNVGRTGRLVPQAYLDAVNVSGVTVQHATLHNEVDLVTKDIREGDEVIVTRAGDVIPRLPRSARHATRQPSRRATGRSAPTAAAAPASASSTSSTSSAAPRWTSTGWGRSRSSSSSSGAGSKALPTSTRWPRIARNCSRSPATRRSRSTRCWRRSNNRSSSRSGACCLRLESMESAA
jgi:DNA ligase (NAD+)